MTSTVKNLGRVETIRVEKQDKWEIVSETCSNWHNKELYSFAINKDKNKKTTQKKTFNNESAICPECNVGILKKREGKFGIFLGCSKFPDCKFTSSKKD